MKMKKGYFIETLLPRGYKNYSSLENGDIVKIVNETECSYRVQIKKRRFYPYIKLVPKSSIILSNNMVFAGEISGEPLLFQKNPIIVYDFIEKNTISHEIKPVYFLKLRTKCYKVLDEKGTLYLLIDSSVTEEDCKGYSYIAVNRKGIVPFRDYSYSLDAVLSFEEDNTIERYLKNLNFERLTFVKEVEKNFFYIKGILERRKKLTINEFEENEVIIPFYVLIIKKDENIPVHILLKEIYG